MRKFSYGERIKTLAEGEFDLERHQHSYGLAEARPGNEAELPGGFDRFLVETEDRIERPHHLHVADAPVRQHDPLKPHNALHLRAHGFRGVIGTNTAQQARRLDAIARPVDTAAGAAAASFAKA